MIIYGGIPDKITYVVKQAHAVTRGWHGLDDLHIAAPVTAAPAFPVDPESKSSMETAVRWAEGWGNKNPSRSVVGDNAPIKEVEVITIDVRAEGGRAYKVRLLDVAEGDLYVDMREDVVLDAMLVNGVKKGGIVKGPFVWGRLHSQLRLVRVGSSLHDAMVKAADRMAEKVVSAKDHVVGGIYLNRKLEALMYLGKCDIDWPEYKAVGPERPYGHNHYAREQRLVRQTERGANLWFELKYHGDGLGTVRKGDADKLASAAHWTKIWEKGYTPEHTWIWGLKEIKKPAVTRHVATVDIDWERLRRAAVEHAAHAAKTDPYRGSPDYAGGLTRVDEKYLHAARLAHVRPAGQPCPEHAEYKALWAKTT